MKTMSSPPGMFDVCINRLLYDSSYSTHEHRYMFELHVLARYEAHQCSK
jgi:hypothetical protein